MKKRLLSVFLVLSLLLTFVVPFSALAADAASEMKNLTLTHNGNGQYTLTFDTDSGYGTDTAYCALITQAAVDEESATADTWAHGSGDVDDAAPSTSTLKNSAVNTSWASYIADGRAAGTERASIDPADNGTYSKNKFTFSLTPATAYAFLKDIADTETTYYVFFATEKEGLASASFKIDANGDIVTPFSASAGTVATTAYDKQTRQVTVTVNNSTGAEISGASVEFGANSPFELVGTAPTSFAEGTNTITVQLKSDKLDAGTYTDTLTIKGDGQDDLSVSLSVTISQKTLGINWNTSPAFADKVYNGKSATDVTLNSGAPALTDVETGDTVSIKTVTYARTNSNIGDSVPVRATVSGLDGAQAGNYKLPTTGLTKNDFGTVKVTPAALTIANGSLAVTEKTYDGNTSATLTGAPALTGVITGDTVNATVATAAAFDNANAGTNKDVTVTYRLGGAQAGNYTLADGSLTVKGTIKPAPMGNISIQATPAGKIDKDTVLSVTLPTGVTEDDVTYAWTVDGTPAGTDPTYTVTDDDLGKIVAVTVTMKDDKNYEGHKSANVKAGTIAVEDPEITGEPKVGQELSLTLKPDGMTAADGTIQWKRGDEVVAGQTGLTYPVSEADLGKTITATVTGKDPYSGTGTATIDIPAVAPSAPLEVTVTETTTSSLSVTWKAPASNGGDANVTYKVQLGDREPVSVNDLTYTFTGLDSDTEYTVKVTAVNGAGESAAGTATGKTKADQVVEPDPEMHKLFMVGYANTDKFGPDDNMTRAQAATLLCRLYDGDETFVDDHNQTVQHAPTGLSDVADRDQWYYAAVGFAQNKNLMEGKNGGIFDPDESIKRGEFAATLVRLMTGQKEAPEVDVSKSQLKDLSGHWAEKYIVYLELETNGLNGMDGTNFRPEEYLTRAQAAKMVNAVFGRLQSVSAEEKDQLAAELNIFSDVERCTWYYNNVIEATVEHEETDKDFHTAG